MTQKEFIHKISQEANLPLSETKDVVKTMCAIIIEQLKLGEKVLISGLGTFKIAETKEREGINPFTKEVIKITAKRKVRFLPAKNLKEEISYNK